VLLLLLVLLLDDEDDRTHMNPSNHLVEADERGLIQACPNCGKRNRLLYERLGHTFHCQQCKTELQHPATPVEIRNSRIFDAFTGRAELHVLVDFWAAWCGPCKMVAPELIKVAAEGVGHWVVAKANTEELPDVAQCLRVSSIPLFALFKNGREIGRQPGAMPAKSIRQLIEQWINQA